MSICRSFTDSSCLCSNKSLYDNVTEGKCLELTKDRKAWHDAQSYCTQQGGKLLEINNQMENENIAGVTYSILFCYWVSIKICVTIYLEWLSTRPEMHLLKSEGGKPVWFGLNTCINDFEWLKRIDDTEVARLPFKYLHTLPTYYNFQAGEVSCILHILCISFHVHLLDQQPNNDEIYGTILTNLNGSWKLDNDAATHYAVCEYECSSEFLWRTTVVSASNRNAVLKKPKNSRRSII